MLIYEFMMLVVIAMINNGDDENRASSNQLNRAKVLELSCLHILPKSYSQALCCTDRSWKKGLFVKVFDRKVHVRSEIKSVTCLTQSLEQPFRCPSLFDMLQSTL